MTSQSIASLTHLFGHQRRNQRLCRSGVNIVEQVNHPNHYNTLGIECIDVVENFNFNRGNAMKYIWRAGLKGDAIQDLQKAAWYINREIERLQKQQEES